MTEIGSQEEYHKAFVSINGENYRCLGLVTPLDDCGYKFVGKGTYSMGYIERVQGADWLGTTELPKELECRTWVQSVYFHDK